MKVQVLAVRDAKTEQFNNPIFTNTVAQAVRGFTDEINRKEGDNMINRHAEDFDLYALGTYDTTTGMFTQDVKPSLVVIGQNLKQP